MTDPRTIAKNKLTTYLDAITDEDGDNVRVRHYFSDTQENLATLFKANKEDLLVVYRRGSGRDAEHAASGIYAYTRNVEVGLACIDKMKDAENYRIKAQKLLNTAIEEVEEVVREESLGSSYVRSESTRFENINTGGQQVFTAWITVPVRSYAV